MRTSTVGFAALLREAQAQRYAGVSYLAKLSALIDIIDLAGSYDPTVAPFTDEERTEVRRLYQEANDLLG